jgi:hypothetical protein
MEEEVNKDETDGCLSGLLRGQGFGYLPDFDMGAWWRTR